MANCIYCGFPAPIGKDRHPDCGNSHARRQQVEIESSTKSIAAPEWLSAEKRIYLQQLEPVIKRAVFRGVLFAGLIFIGIGLVIGVFVTASR